MPVIKTCPVCNSEFSVAPYRADKAKFCSRSCTAKFWNPRNVNRISAISGKKPHNFAACQIACLECGKEFFISPCRKGSQKFCSAECYSIFQRLDNPSGYVRITVDGKRVREHRWLVERSIGRKLLPSEHVHHINRDKSDNRLENLAVLDWHEHGRLHGSERRK